MSKGYIIRRVSEVAPTPCPCGESRRAVTGEDNDAASVHVVTISKDSKRHFHKRLTEFYYVLEGQGEMLLDDDVVPIGPGMVVCIKPGTVHVARGNLKIVNFVVPPFDADDEYVVE